MDIILLIILLIVIYFIFYVLNIILNKKEFFNNINIYIDNKLINNLKIEDSNIDSSQMVESDIPPFPIDIVYTWSGEKVSNNIRESYNYELQYSLRSIEMYAPWVNKIYILIDAPKKFPSWIDENNDKIIMIDTTETFPSDKYLPNNNSNAIETTIINIPNLSEHYIYFCDDIFLGRKTKYTDFFTSDGKALVCRYSISNNTILKHNFINLLKINFPPTVNKLYPHVPIPQIKSVIEEFFNLYPDYIDWIRSTKKRSDDGTGICNLYFLNRPCQQIHYPICKYMLIKNKAVLTFYGNPTKHMFIRNDEIYKYHSKITVFDVILIIKPLYYCINDDEKDVEKRIKVREMMLSFFNKYYPNKASFEK